MRQPILSVHGAALPVAPEANHLVLVNPPREDEPPTEEAFMEAREWLDSLHSRMVQGPDETLHAGMTALHGGLIHRRRRWSPEVWKRFCQELARKHPMRPFLHQCPFTRHAFERPRGYAGDAALIDYLYMDHAADELHAGREIYRYMHGQPSARSVRERRELLARMMDETAARRPDGRVLSVACGHLREAESSRAVVERKLQELIAFDQDPVSLAEISRLHPGGIVRPVCGSVRSLLAGKAVFQDLDFAYSAGLYDYLSDSVAARLTALLFQMLRPGGRLLVANFAVHPPETGYMEAFMDWWLTYRDEDGMRDLLSETPLEQVDNVRLFRDSQDNVIYLEVTRR
ncbi:MULTISPECIES: class I SAM-dependent methyltransferase [unclassified Corallococcus]|uniref:class I SAM-dependent methyltransferase n=1 Tax=unclassified Corallococcus TaxID=2685029 RepID=UPI001A8E373A|nr:MULTISPECIES: class I SAM-dependent methyltransferase [unclassified Corallococcus]MBN9682503.1 class I SAM-dependent methyltransferase [Corallococcus sp. NCSPR001]WAS85945.1 class I SAM-dependent methyltransferase [Corallococcus sp. NCRR]